MTATKTSFAPAALASTAVVTNRKGEYFVARIVDDLCDAAREDMIRRGWDGHMYYITRVTEGAKRAALHLAYRVSGTGEFTIMF